MDHLEIKPLTAPPHATIRVPGSKSITNRALVLAALSRSGTECQLQGALRSEDTEVMIESLRKLGFQIETDWTASTIRVKSSDDDEPISAREADLFVANSGTTMRFLTAMVSLGHGRYRLDGAPRMRERPIHDLLSALRQLGVRARSEKDDGCPPVIVEGSGLQTGSARVKADISSQFLSGLLMTVPLAQGAVRVTVEGALVSWPYVEMTLGVMAKFNVAPATYSVECHEKATHITFLGRQRYQISGSFAVEPDATAASYFFAAAAISGGRVSVPGMGKDSLQGDIRFIRILENMRCHVDCAGSLLTVSGGLLRGIDVDMNDISDTVMTLAAVACFAEGPTTIRNVAHIRHKETDRLAALATELRRVGAEVEEFPDGLKVTPRPLHGAEIETYNDHRMAMSMALIGLKVPGIVIKNPGCVAKTYPRFWEDLEKLRTPDV
jgi:3-phosphoshikimate 1-carboxyvinyltransferase